MAVRGRGRLATLAALAAGAVLVLLAALALDPRVNLGARGEAPGVAPAPALEPGDRPSESEVPSLDAARCAGPAPAPQNAAFEEQVAQLVDEQRRLAGLPPLTRAEALTSSARWFARDMAVEDYFALDHDTYTRERGRLVRACDWRTRLAWYYEDWTSLAENVAAGYATPQDVVDGWMRSPTHRAKILSPGSWETGVGYWSGGSQGHYWVEDFGRRDRP